MRATMIHVYKRMDGRALLATFGVLGIAAGLVLWSSLQAETTGMDWWRSLWCFVLIGACAWALGSSVVSLTRLTATTLDGPFLRVLLGLVVFAALNVLIVFVLPDSSAPFALLVLAGLSVWFVVKRKGVRSKKSPLGATFEWAGLSALLAVGSSSISFLSFADGSVKFTQYWDLLYHLASIKAALREGFPLATNPLVSGAPPMANHYTFSALGETVTRIAGAEASSSLFSVVLPLLSLLLLGSLCLAAWAVSRDFIGALALPLLVALTSGVAYMTARLPVLTTLVSPQSLRNLAYFYWNPPAALALSATALVIVLFVAAEDGRTFESVVSVAAILAGVTVAMKATTAIAVVPALCITLALVWRRKQISARLLLVSWGLAAVSGAAYYLTTLGSSRPIGISFGEYSSYLMSRAIVEESGALRFTAQVSERLGVVGELAFLPIYAVAVFLGWRLLVVCLPLLKMESRIVWQRRLTGAAAFYSASVIVIALVIGLTLVQSDTGRFTAWNIAGHTVANIYWLGLVWAAAATAQLLGHLSIRRNKKFVVVAIAASLASVLILTGAIKSIRQVGTDAVPYDAYVLLDRLEYTTPRDAVVMQGFEIERNAWVSGIGGRQAFLERAETFRAYEPGFAVEGTERVRLAYSATSGTELASSHLLEGIDYALVGPGQGLGLREIGEIKDRSGEWVLLELAVSSSR